MTHISDAFAVVRQHSLLAFGTTILLVLFANVFYNLYLHPLRRFPGPFWARATDFWKFMVVFQKNGHTRAIELHKKYGPVIRVAPNAIVCNDPKFLPEIYHRKADKTDTYTPAILGEIPPPFQTQPHEEHAMKRKRVAAAYTMTNLKKFEKDIDATIVELVEAFKIRYASTGHRLDWADWSKWFVYDAVSLLAFGKPIGFIHEARDVGGLIKAFHDMALMAGLVAILPWLMKPLLHTPILKQWLMPTPGDGSGTGKIMQFRDNMLKDRLEKPQVGSHGDLLDNLLRAKEHDPTMTMDDIRSECFVLMVAAPDTTAGLICPLIHHIISSPSIYSKVMSEIAAFERADKLSNPVASYDETNAMPYFTVCVKETLRFNPSTPFPMPRYVPKNGMRLPGGLYAPEGAELAADPYNTNRHPSIYGSDADVFRPERWLESEERAKEMDKYLLSFGYGARVCLGKHLGLLQAQKLCLQFLRDFWITSANPTKPFVEKNMAIMMYFDQYLFTMERQRGSELTDEVVRMLAQGPKV